MKNVPFLISKINQRHVQVLLLVLTLSMLVLAAGAPGAFGDINGSIGFTP